jgi:hypothetical protein
MAKQFPSFIYGVHDLGGDAPIVGSQRTGWVLDAVDLGTQTGYDYSALVQAGIEPIVRLSHGFEPAGTIPPSDQYDAFAEKCAGYVRNSPGARTWVIGNEMNHRTEWPQLADGTRQVITPTRYTECFQKCRSAIKGTAGHAHDWVALGAVAPCTNHTTYPGNERGDWVQYLLDLLNLLGDQVDAITLHCYTQDYSVEQITSEAMMDPPFTDRHFRFRMYRDFLTALPERFRMLPVLITETNPSAGWRDDNIGWVQAAYREIDAWNAVSSNQPIQSLVLFRWKVISDHPEWGIQNKPQVLDDFKSALAAGYSVRWHPQYNPAPFPIITQVTFTPTSLAAGDLLQVSITVTNNSTATLPTQGPDPGFVYEEGDTFATRGYPDVGGNWRVGVDLDNRTGVDHPYRWGLGTPLAPGETRTITGAIRLKTPQTQNYWAGLVQEHIAWHQDRQGVQSVSVTPQKLGLQITNVTFTPTTLSAGQYLSVGITVRNDSAAPLPTQGPDPGFVYEEGDTFATRGYPDIGGNWRVGVDFDNRTGIDHPFRWGLGTSLAPGETRVITGAIRLKNAQAQDYWAGSVHEHIAWIQDRQGVQAITVKPGVQITNVAFTPTTLSPDQPIEVSITVRNDGDTPLPTQGPDPGFIYAEGDTFETRGYPAISGNWRVGVDFDNRTGVDHPYRWGFGSPLAPGESRVISGKIVLRNLQSRNYWAGLVHEYVAWIQDRQGVQTITVTTAPQITNVSFSPTSVEVGQSLNVSITVRNGGTAPLPTQGPNPGFAYEEGDTFASRGFPAIAGNLRVGVDFDERTGVDHPYRWGLGAPLAPRESRTITGTIRMKNPRAQYYWAGLVQEQVAWHHDRQGIQVVRVPYPGPRPRVVHTHSVNATTWNGQADFWRYVNQGVVNEMVDRGVMTLTRASSAADAWRALLPRYQAGQGIAIKVNMTNGGNGRLDALYQTINAIARGLTQIGVCENDIWVYDATDNLPNHFVQGCQYPGILFYDEGAHNRATFDSTDPTAYITFSPPPGVQPPPPVKLTDVLINAKYIINIPILKGHFTGAGVTLAFKNHLGSTNNPVGFHDYIFPSGTYFRADYNPLVDMYRNPHVGAKTVLTIGEGLFAGTTWDSLPLPMATFGNKPPNSLFFATDPVALDCVMYDLLAAEWEVPAGAGYYLPLAGSAGLGVFEHGKPWTTGYLRMDYERVEI